MNASICPTIDAADSTEFRAQTERVVPFATRLHIDVADGSMTPNTLVEVADVWWPGGVRADIHVMTRRPLDHLAALIALGPQLVIVHAEADGDFFELTATLRAHGIETGVALLPETPVEAIVPAIDVIDHVLIFSGNLGHFGGVADLGLLSKAQQLKQLKPQLELGWDGGVNADNVRQLAEAGIEVLNVGGYIQKSDNPHAAYATLKTELRSQTPPLTSRVVPGAAYQSRPVANGGDDGQISKRAYNAAHLFHRRTRTQG